MNAISVVSLYEIYQQYRSVTTDTRQVKPGDIFFALKGEKFNGNLYAKQAIEAGASFAISDDETIADGDRIIYCHDVLNTLQQLAKFHRNRLNIPVIAITGSNGKTTTKELVHIVLSTRYKTYTTQGNLNNHIGIPLTLLRIQPDAEIAVVEMGANHQKEIESYCTYTFPSHGMITNCGKAHLEGFGGVEGVRIGKGELYDFLRAHNGVVFACDDFDYFHEMSKGITNLHWYGTKQGEVTGVVGENEPFLEVMIRDGFEERFLLKTKLVGSYNIYNILAACAIGKFFGITATDIKRAIEAYEPTNSRSQLMLVDGNQVILDAYNANPTSMQAAIENFAALPVENKILFLGGMMELGEESIAEHEAIVSLIDKHNWKNVILVGGDFANVDYSYLFFPSAAEAATWWKQQHEHGNYLLVKGSRSIRMEQIIEVQKEQK